MLHSPDFLVPDPDATVARLVDRIGLPPPDPRWAQEFPGHGYRAIFARVHRSRSFAPSRLEIIGPRPVPQPEDPAIPRAGDSRPDDDAGIFFEAIPTQGLLLQTDPSDPPPPPPEPLVPGQMARILAREYLVADLDQALRTLSKNLDFETVGPVATERDDGSRRAILAMTMPHAATLELVQPIDTETEAARYLGRWGAGPYYTRIAVAGLEAKAEDLQRRGTEFRRVPGERPRLRVAVDGALFEFVELGDAA